MSWAVHPIHGLEISSEIFGELMLESRLPIVNRNSLLDRLVQIDGNVTSASPDMVTLILESQALALAKLYFLSGENMNTVVPIVRGVPSTCPANQKIAIDKTMY